MQIYFLVIYLYCTIVGCIVFQTNYLSLLISVQTMLHNRQIVEPCAAERTCLGKS